MTPHQHFQKTPSEKLKTRPPLFLRYLQGYFESQDCIIRVNETQEYFKIMKDKNFPFVSIRENWSRPYVGADLFRYGTHVRTIWRKLNYEYEVETHTKLDEKAVLKCFKNFYFENSSRDNLLLRAALVNVDNQGILITGKCRSGKTTLAQSMAVTAKARLVSGGNTLISIEKGELIGNYIPRPFYIRFSTIASSSELIPVLRDLESCNAVQYLDEDALRRIISSRSFDVNAGLCISRRKYADLLAIKTEPSAKIDKIIFTQYSPGIPQIKGCSVGEALRLLKQRILPKKINLFKLEETIPLDKINLDTEWIINKKLIKISFAGPFPLTKSLLEDIVAI